MKKSVILFTILLATACAKVNALKEYPDSPALLERANNFYTFILNKEIGIRHNDQEEEFRKFFLDEESYYDFLDSYLYILRERDIFRNTISNFVISEIQLAEDGSSAEIKVVLFSKDAYMIYRKIEATHQWFKSDDQWWPRKISAPKLNWYEKYTKRYGFPPRR